LNPVGSERKNDFLKVEYMNRFVTVGQLSYGLLSEIDKKNLTWEPSLFDGVVDHTVRKSSSCNVMDKRLADLIYDEIKWAFPEREGYVSYLNPMIRFLRYKEGDFFFTHYDENYVDDEGGQSEYTLQVCLNTCIGGALTFIKPALQMECERGTFVLFHQDFEHKVEKIKAKERYVMRTELLYKKC